MAQVSVEIDGKTYRMACGEGEEDHLVHLAGRFDRTLQDLKGAFGPIGDHRLTVMAGIATADRLDEAEKRIATLETRMAALTGDDPEAAKSEQELSDAIVTATKWIDRLAVKLRSLSAEEPVPAPHPRIRATG